MKPDAPKDVREGEALDLARLADWLRTQQLPHEPLSQQQFPRGHSNLTYLLRAGAAEYVLRRPPFGSQVKSAHDMGREARILSKLHPVFPKAPRVVAICDDATVLGAPFYLMERVQGAILRGPAPREAPSESQMRALCLSFVRTLADLHAVDFHAAGLEGRPDGFLQRQVEGWTKRWHDAKTEDVPDAEELARWLAGRIPVSGAPAFIHNDYKFDNIVLAPDDPSRIVGVLDWELSTVGDPLADLGTAIGYWVEETDPEPLKAFAFGPTYLPGCFTRGELVAEYARITGRDVSRMLFYFVFALFKIAVIAQQIYKRYVQGLTHDERFATLGMGVQLLARAGAEAVEKGAY